MSECEDMTTLMAKELMLGIKDSVEDVASLFKRMAVLKPQPMAGPAPPGPPASPALPAPPEGRENGPPPTEPTALLPPPLELSAVSAHQRRRGRKNIGINENQLLLFQIA